MHTRHALMTAPVLAGLLVLVASAPALAQEPDDDGGYGSADVIEETDVVLVEAEAGKPGSDGGPGDGGEAVCDWTPVPPEYWEQQAESLSQRDLVQIAQYDWYWRDCPTPDGSTTRTLVAVPQDDDEPTPSVPELRDRAVDRLEPVAPTITMNPTGTQMVRLATWLWIDESSWQTITASASAGPVTTTATATPYRVTWDMGNGDTVVCEGPGLPYGSSDADGSDPRQPCTYTYERTSADQPGQAYRVTATVHWRVSWQVTGAPGGGTLTDLQSSSTVSVPVAEMQALNR